jgi:hypothetical protein
MSSQPDDEQKPTSPNKDDLQPVSFDRFDKLIIVCLISVFVVLFIWLLAFNKQPFYSYLTFLGLLTLVLVGILRAVGLFRTSMIALGGAAGVFVGLFLLTEKYYDQSEQIKDQNEQIKVLKCLDPACNTLRRYFGFIQARDFKTRYHCYRTPGNGNNKSGLVRIIMTNFQRCLIPPIVTVML